MMDMLCGRMKRIIVDVEKVPISHELRGNYDTDNEFKATFQQWLNALWTSKDKRIAMYSNNDDITAH